MLNRDRIIRTIAPAVFVLWTVLLLGLTLLPGSALPDAKVFIHDKIGHFGLFGGWTFFLGLSLVVYRAKINVRLWRILIAGILLGALIELMQHMMNIGRSASWGDVGANALGCFAACLVLYPLRHYLARKTVGNKPF